MRGKASGSVQSVRFNRDHPRLCGEKGLIEILENGELGSPPPMRGKGPAVVFRVRNIGITPAYAGKSRRIVTCRLHRGDHPRLCGEKRDSSPQELLAAGSPPPMRGKENIFFLALHIDRITPAYAGKSWQPGKVPPLP